MGKNVSREARTSPVVKVSYPTIFTPGQKYDNYNITMMIPKKGDDAALDFMKKLHADAKACLVEHWPDEAKRPRIPLVGHDKSPIKDGDKNSNNVGIPLSESNPEYAGHWLIRMTRSSKQGKPLVVDNERNEVRDQGQIYGGCYCKINTNAFSFEGENSGVTFGLNGVQFIKDGEPFGEARLNASDMFEKEAGGKSDSSNYSDGDDPFGDGSDSPSKGDVDPFDDDVSF